MTSSSLTTAALAKREGKQHLNQLSSLSETEIQTENRAVNSSQEIVGGDKLNHKEERKISAGDKINHSEDRLMSDELSLVNELHRRINSLQEALDEAMEATAHYDSEATQLKKQNSSLKSENEQLRESNDVLKRQVEELRRTNNTNNSDSNGDIASTLTVDIPYHEITLGHCIGEGGYGEVFKAHWHGQNVAVKRVKLSSLIPSRIENLIHESRTVM